MQSPTTTYEDKEPGDWIHLINHLETINFSVRIIREYTRRDPLLSQVYCFLMSGWPESADSKDLKIYHKIASELSVSDGCILRGSRVIIPPHARKSVLDELHSGHPGCGKMKALARSYVW